MTDARHLDLVRLQGYLDADVRAVIPIAGSPPTFLVVDPERDRLSVRVEMDTAQTVAPSPYRRIVTRTVSAENRRWAECSVEGLSVAPEAYPVLCAIVDRVQTGLTFDEAVRDAVASFRAVVQAIGQLSENEETGLIGELLVLKHLVDKRGDSALKSWRGFAAEEHDFDLGGADLEVKSTTGERRRHWIGSLTQLEPTPSRPLWLVSVQLTRAAAEGDSFGLPTLIESISESLADQASRRLLDNQLGLLHWGGSDIQSYVRRFRMRTRPAVFRVSGGFPALTAAALEAAGLRLSAFPRVTYQVDLSGVHHSDEPPSDLTDLYESLDPDA
jgi:hypothetical protein